MMINRRELEKFVQDRGLKLHDLAPARANAILEGIIELACERARKEGRKTLMPRDMPFKDIEKPGKLPMARNWGTVDRPMVQRQIIEQGRPYRLVERRQS